MSVNSVSKPFLRALVGVFNIKKAVSSLSGSFWFLPSVMIACVIVISRLLSTHQLDDYSALLKSSQFGIADAKAAMQIVQVIATASITITSIAFSMTIVALVMASNQFGPRLLKGFMQNKSTQLVLGTFTATFVFCLMVMSQIDMSGNSMSYPAISVLATIVLAVVCVFVLIFYIHHVATSIRADSVVKQVANDLQQDMQILQNQTSTRVSFNILEVVRQHPYKLVISSEYNGYLQAIEYQSIIRFADELRGIVDMHVRAGIFVLKGTPVATVLSDAPLPSSSNSAYQNRINNALVFGEERTALQDPLFAVNQLVEMALRALSPSLNDPFTAINCIDRLAEALSSFTDRTLPKNALVNEQGKLCVINCDLTYAALFDGAFTQIRQSCSTHIFVLMHLLDTFTLLIKASNNAVYVIDAVNRQLSDIKKEVIQKKVISGKNDQQLYEHKINTLSEYTVMASPIEQGV